MPLRTIFLFTSLICCVLAFHERSAAQGGWRQWEIHFRDGTTLEASPLAINEKGRFTRSMGKESGFKRSTIAYLSIARTELPPFPKGPFRVDQVVRLDGSRSAGPITFRSLKFSEGELVQKGKRTTLENIAYIIFAAPRTRGPSAKRKH
jgi:hypothetical protein